MNGGGAAYAVGGGSGMPTSITTCAGGGNGVRRSSSSISGSESDSTEDAGRTPSQSHQPVSSNRKRRRGIIEKRRRDRINNSLNELRRLVPAAFEKQGSQKLEKAEILQLTVEHLRYLHSKGMDSIMYDPQRVATDYQAMGYRECASEVARYLSSVEGLDLQDPLRMRLLSHLQCYSAQKVAAYTSFNQLTHWSGNLVSQNYPTGVSVSSNLFQSAFSNGCASQPAFATDSPMSLNVANYQATGCAQPTTVNPFKTPVPFTALPIPQSSHFQNASLTFHTAQQVSATVNLPTGQNGSGETKTGSRLWETSGFC